MIATIQAVNGVTNLLKSVLDKGIVTLVNVSAHIFEYNAVRNTAVDGLILFKSTKNG